MPAPRCWAGRTAQFAGAIERAIAGIAGGDALPDAIAAHRVTEVLVWLALRGVRFAPMAGSTLALRVRRLVEAAPAQAWAAAAIARQLAMSEATLRRRLAVEGTTLGELLVDVRMSTALVLLQSTRYPVQRIAADVGYESASRFAIRFRERFGFAPSTVRGGRGHREGLSL